MKVDRNQEILLREIAADISLRYLGLQGAVDIRNRMILELYEAGISQAAIAEAAGLSPQRVNQLVYDSQPEENGR